MAPESGQKTMSSAAAALISARSPGLSFMPDASEVPWKSLAAPTPRLASVFS